MPVSQSLRLKLGDNKNEHAERWKLPVVGTDAALARVSPCRVEHGNSLFVATERDGYLGRKNKAGALADAVHLTRRCQLWMFAQKRNGVIPGRTTKLLAFGQI